MGAVLLAAAGGEEHTAFAPTAAIVAVSVLVGVQCATATAAHAKVNCLKQAARRVRSAQLGARHGT